MGEFQRIQKFTLKENIKLILVYAGGTNDPKILKICDHSSNIYLKNKNVSIDFCFQRISKEHTFDAVSAAIQWETYKVFSQFYQYFKKL